MGKVYFDASVLVLCLSIVNVARLTRMRRLATFDDRMATAARALGVTVTPT